MGQSSQEQTPEQGAPSTTNAEQLSPAQLSSTLRRVPELGPLFEPANGGAQQERVAEEGTAEQGAEASGGMEVETVICD